jgi:hypothetical protein
MTFLGRGGCVVASPGLPGRYPCLWRGGGVLLVTTRQHVVGSPGPSLPRRRVGALTYPRSIRKRKQCVDMALRWELIALSLLAGIGFGTDAPPLQPPWFFQL